MTSCSHALACFVSFSVHPSLCETAQQRLMADGWMEAVRGRRQRADEDQQTPEALLFDAQPLFVMCSLRLDTNRAARRDGGSARTPPHFFFFQPQRRKSSQASSKKPWCWQEVKPRRRASRAEWFAPSDSSLLRTTESTAALQTNCNLLGHAKGDLKGQITGTVIASSHCTHSSALYISSSMIQTVLRLKQTGR